MPREFGPTVREELVPAIDERTGRIKRGGELSTATSEGFAEIPSYRDLNVYQIRKYAPEASRLLDRGTGTGSMIRWMGSAGKLVGDFKAVGVDINEGDLQKARERFRNFGDSISFVQASADNLPFPDEQFDLVIDSNYGHLLQEKLPLLFEEGFRVAKKGATEIYSSGYVKGVSLIDTPTSRVWQGLMVYSRRILPEVCQERGEEYTMGEAVDLMIHTREDIENMISGAGFKKVETEVHRVEFIGEQATKLVCVPEFALGVLPITIAGDDEKKTKALSIAQEVLPRALDMSFERFKTDRLKRDWLFAKGVK